MTTTIESQVQFPKNASLDVDTAIHLVRSLLPSFTEQTMKLSLMANRPTIALDQAVSVLTSLIATVNQIIEKDKKESDLYALLNMITLASKKALKKFAQENGYTPVTESSKTAEKQEENLLQDIMVAFLDAMSSKKTGE